MLHGIVKIASKMGISTIQSYQGAKIFEAIGISKEVVDTYFNGTVSRVGGIDMDDIEKQVDARHTKAFDPLVLRLTLPLTAWESTREEAVARSTDIIPRRYICFSRQRGREITVCISSTAS